MRPFIVAAVARVDTFVGSARASSLLVGIELARAALPAASESKNALQSERPTFESLRLIFVI